MDRAKLFLAVLAVGFVACGGAPGVRAKTTRTVGPDGQQAWIVKCTDMASCWEAAGMQCPRGYERLDESRGTSAETEGGANEVQWSPNVTTRSATAKTTTKVHGQMLISCK